MNQADVLTRFEGMLHPDTKLPADETAAFLVRHCHGNHTEAVAVCGRLEQGEASRRDCITFWMVVRRLIVRDSGAPHA